MSPKRSRTPWRIGSRASKRFPRVAACRADAFSRAVIDGHENERRPLAHGHRGRHVRAPHHVRDLRGARAVMCLRAVRPAHAVRGLEVVLPHQPAHPFLRRADPRDPEFRPGLPIPFAMKGRRFEHPANVADQDVVWGRADRPAAPTRHLGRCRLPPRVDAGASAVPHPADPLQAVRPTRGDRVGASHRLDLHRAKGPPASSWSTFAYSNSVSISSSPILACSRRLSSFRASGARLFRLAWPASLSPAALKAYLAVSDP